MPTIANSELDKYLLGHHRNSGRAAETAASTTFTGTLNGSEMRDLFDVLDSQGWHLELAAGVLTAKVGKG